MLWALHLLSAANERAQAETSSFENARKSAPPSTSLLSFTVSNNSLLHFYFSLPFLLPFVRHLFPLKLRNSHSHAFFYKTALMNTR